MISLPNAALERNSTVREVQHQLLPLVPLHKLQTAPDRAPGCSLRRGSCGPTKWTTVTSPTSETRTCLDSTITRYPAWNSAQTAGKHPSRMILPPAPQPAGQSCRTRPSPARQPHGPPPTVLHQPPYLPVRQADCQPRGFAGGRGLPVEAARGFEDGSTRRTSAERPACGAPLPCCWPFSRARWISR